MLDSFESKYVRGDRPDKFVKLEALEGEFLEGLELVLDLSDLLEALLDSSYF